MEIYTNKNSVSPKINKSKWKKFSVYIDCFNRIISTFSSNMTHIVEIMKQEILSSFPKTNTCGVKSKNMITNKAIIDIYIKEKVFAYFPNIIPARDLYYKTLLVLIKSKHLKLLVSGNR